MHSDAYELRRVDMGTAESTAGLAEVMAAFEPAEPPAAARAADVPCAPDDPSCVDAIMRYYNG